MEANSITLACQICHYYILQANEAMMRRLSLEAVADAVSEHFAENHPSGLQMVQCTVTPKAQKGH